MNSAINRFKALTSSNGLIYNSRIPHDNDCDKLLAVTNKNTSRSIFNTVTSDSCFIGKIISIKKKNIIGIAPIKTATTELTINNIISVGLCRLHKLVTREKMRIERIRKDNCVKTFPIIIGYFVPETNANIFKKPSSLIRIKLVVTSIDMTKVI